MAENTLAENITQAISDFGSIKTAIENKGVQIPSGTTTSQYASKIASIPTGGGDEVKKLLDGSIETITIPSDLTSLRQHAFAGCGLTSITIPDNVTIIGSAAFYNCNRLTNLSLSNNITQILEKTFQNCANLASVILPEGITYLRMYAFDWCTNLSTLYIPSSLTTAEYSSFTNCPNLQNVTIGNGFNGSGLNLSASTRYTVQTIVDWLNALADRTGQTAYTLRIGSTNLNKLTAEQIAIATNKNWNLA